MLLRHHGVLGHTPVAGEADGFALGAQLRETGATGSAAATALYRDCNHPISRAYPRHTLSNRLDDAGKLVTQRYGRPDPLEPGVRPERVNIAATDATGGYSEQRLSGAGPGDRYVLDISFSGLATRFHESLHLHTPPRFYRRACRITFTERFPVKVGASRPTRPADARWLARLPAEILPLPHEDSAAGQRSGRE